MDATQKNYIRNLKISRSIFLVCIALGLWVGFYLKSGDESFGALISIFFFVSGLSYVSLCSRQGYKNLWIGDKILFTISILSLLLGLVVSIYLIFK